MRAVLDSPSSSSVCLADSRSPSLSPEGAVAAVIAPDDGFLTASEIATLKLDADWVILSACNTAGGAGENAEALSGLARAFFYAGARALLVSHWEVGSDAAVKLTTKAFAELKSIPASAARKPSAAPCAT